MKFIQSLQFMYVFFTIKKNYESYAYLNMKHEKYRMISLNVNKKLMVILSLLLILLISGILIIYQLGKPDVKEVIDQSIKKQENPEFDTNEEEEVTTNEDSEEESFSNQVKESFVESVIQVVDFFFQREFAIVGIGDSLTRGVGDSTEQGGYIGILDRSINKDRQTVSFSNFGKTGNRTDQLLERIDEPEITAALQEAEIVLITIGANDIMQVAKENFTHLTYDVFMKEMVHFEERLREIFEKMNHLNPKAHIYLVGIYNPFQQYFGDIEELDAIVNDWNLTSQTIVDDYEYTTFIPIKDLFENPSERLLSDDNFHPNDLGYRLMAKRVLEFLTPKEEG